MSQLVHVVASEQARQPKETELHAVQEPDERYEPLVQVVQLKEVQPEQSVKRLEQDVQLPDVELMACPAGQQLMQTTQSTKNVSKM